MLGRLGVGARDEHAPLRVLRAARPHLLAGHDPLVAVLDRAGFQRGEVRAGVGLGEALAPDLLGREDRRRGSAPSARACPTPSASGRRAAGRACWPRTARARGRSLRSRSPIRSAWRRGRRTRSAMRAPPSRPSYRRRCQSRRQRVLGVVARLGGLGAGAVVGEPLAQLVAEGRLLGAEGQVHRRVENPTLGMRRARGGGVGSRTGRVGRAERRATAAAALDSRGRPCRAQTARRAPRRRRLLRLGRAAPPPRAARPAGRRRRQRAARGRDDRQLRGAALRRRLGDARGAGAAAVPRRGVPARPTSRPTARSRARMMDIVRAHVERVEVVGLDEAYLDLEGLFSPRAAMRRLVAEIRAATQLTCSVGHRPEQARREGRLRRREARRLRRARPRAGVRALRRLAARPGAGDRAEDRRAAGRARAAHARGGRRARPSSCSSSASGRTSAASSAGARASNTTARSAPRARSSRSRASAPSTPTSAIPPSCARRSARMAGELCESLAAHRAQRAHDRDQGPPRRLHHGHPRAHASPQPTCDAERWSPRRAAAARGLRAAAARAAARRARRRPGCARTRRRAATAPGRRGAGRERARAAARAAGLSGPGAIARVLGSARWPCASRWARSSSTTSAAARARRCC